MQRLVPIAVAAGLVLAAAVSLAQTPGDGAAERQGEPPAAPKQQDQLPSEPQSQSKGDAQPKATEQFTFHKVDNGFLRLDGKTGKVSLCSARAVGWACQAVPEERAALDKEISRLQGEVAALKKEIAALRAAPVQPAPSAGNGEGKLKLPDKIDIARARAFIEETWRQLMDMIVTMQKDMMRKG